GLPLDVAAANPSVMGDIVFFVVLESLNSHMVGDRITPQLMKASRDGIMFREFYANSIQSERSWEGILCGTPPGITRHLVEEYDADDIRKMPCLPGLFEKLGYRSMVFYGGTENPRAMKLFDALGFDDILTDEIMQPEDIKYDWGYREDIFFSRIDEYLQKHHADEKLFVFITNSATNHTPFEVLDEAYLDDVPFPDPQLFEERLSNTTYIQDDYFGHFYNLYRNNYSHRSSLFVMSDHAWPVPIHEQNIYNERGAYEENFLISLLYVPPAIQNAHFAGPSDVPLRYSQMDILPTIFDLIGLQTTFHLGESFAPWLLASPAEKLPDAVKPKISVQPYGGGFISVVRYPRKYLFDILAGNLVVFDLENDPQERSPSKRNISQYMHLIHDFFGHKKAGPR
ncbi:MAG TPA: sulfatase-like hydrolase/transferase, partial [Acidobacteriota bacterium]|nr:sulfatase-like hydrolase/transferase [Acidobacteriota bacterium]